MKKFFVVQRFIHNLLRELAYEVVIDRTHRERDKVLTRIINHAAQEWQRIVDMSEDNVEGMDDIPF